MTISESNDTWSRLRREWREATDRYLRALCEGWDDGRVREECRKVAGLSIRLRIFEQGRRSIQ